MDEMAAAAEPEMAPKSMHVTVFTKASPPGSLPTSVAAKSIKRRAKPPAPMSSPARMKNGIANRAKELTEFAISLTTVEVALG